MTEKQDQNPVGVIKLNRLISYWRGLGRELRIGIIAMAVALFIVAVFIANGFFAGEEMSVLFSDLEPYQAREVIEQLEEKKIPFQVGDGGRQILVPQDQRDRLRLILSPAVYAQGKGFALFENGGLMVSDFDRRVQLQMALEEELRRTISSIDVVEQVRVHLVIPERSAFVRHHGEASASIFLRLKPQASLSEHQIRGIVSLVAGSVDGLRPEQVTIIDSQLNVLFDGYGFQEHAGFVSSLDNRLKQKRDFERELENRLKQLLEKVYGPGKVVAMVSADLDFSTRERTVVSYDDEPVSRSEHRLMERHFPLDGAAGEVGDSNIPGYVVLEEEEEGYGYLRIEEMVNYEIGETREHISMAPGRIERLSAAVIIDESLATENLAAQVGELVAAAMGLDDQRGDTVTVQTLPFASPWPDDPQPQPHPEVREPLLKPVFLAAVFALLVLAAGLYLLLRGAAGRRQAQAPPVFVDTSEQETREPRGEKPPEDSKQEKLRRMAEEDAEGVAQVLRTWLAGE